MQKQIEKIEYFACGYCVSYLHHMFRGAPKQAFRFVAGVFLLKHKNYGYILYDTGYGREMKEKKRLRYLLYDLANPFYIEEKDEIAYQLRKKGILPEDIRFVILSHLHPAHIGGAKAFPNARFILTMDLRKQWGRFTMRDLVFKELLPEDFPQRLIPVNPNTFYKGFPFCKVFDFFGDNSLLICSMDGHATGQACVYIPEYTLFLAADVCWGIPLLRYTSRIRILPLLIQKDRSAYFKNIWLLQQMQKDGISVIVSHDKPKRIQRLLASAGEKEYE